MSDCNTKIDQGKEAIFIGAYGFGKRIDLLRNVLSVLVPLIGFFLEQLFYFFFHLNYLWSSFSCKFSKSSNLLLLKNWYSCCSYCWEIVFHAANMLVECMFEVLFSRDSSCFSISGNYSCCSNIRFRYLVFLLVKYLKISCFRDVGFFKLSLIF